jgi:hypothetical protein
MSFIRIIIVFIGTKSINFYDSEIAISYLKRISINMLDESHCETTSIKFIYFLFKNILK